MTPILYKMLQLDQFLGTQNQLLYPTKVRESLLVFFFLPGE